MSRVLLLLALVGGVAVGAGWWLTEPAPREPTAFDSDEWVPCSPAGAASSTLLCRGVDVPVDPAEPSGERLRIPVVKQPALGKAGATAGTVFYHPGGPAPNVAELVATDALRRRLPGMVYQDRDVVSWELRGLGASEPRLACPEAEEALEAKDVHASYDDAIEAAKDVVRAVRKCLKRTRLPANLSVPRMADDLEAVRAALGVEKIHLVGFSFSSGIGLAYAARYPERLASLVLGLVAPYPGLDQDEATLPPLPPRPPDEEGAKRDDAATPDEQETLAEIFAESGHEAPSVDQLERAARAAARLGTPEAQTRSSLFALCATCMRQPACPLGPEPVVAIDAMLRLLNQGPQRTREGEPFSKGHLNLVLGASLNRRGEDRDQLLAALATFHYERDPTALMAIYKRHAVFSVDHSGLYSWVISCSASAPAVPDEDTWRRHWGRGRPMLCDADHPPAEHRLPGRATFPALLLAGERDSSTPLLAARRAAARLEAPLLVIPGGGHALAGTCAVDALARFFAHPEAPLESGWCEPPPAPKP